MSFKVVRNGGRVVAFGPNDDNYEPAQPYEIENIEPSIFVDSIESIISQIDALERQHLMPRATREFMLMYMEANAPTEVLAVNPGYQAVKAFDEQIKALRAQL